MRYLLVLGFACAVYRREPRARIFVNDQLIDEFNIIDCKPTTLTSELVKDILTPDGRRNLQSFQRNNYIPLRFYEVNVDHSLHKLKIKIEIKNNDSNYTNYFMSKSTLLQLQLCYFFPLDSKLLNRLDFIQKKNKRNKNCAWLRSHKNIIFNIVTNGLLWKGENGQNIHSTTADKLDHYNIGGRGYFVCTLIKKYGIFITDILKKYRFCYPYETVNDLLHKYQQHAHLRDSD